MNILITLISGFEICKGFTLIICFFSRSTDQIAEVFPIFLLILGIFKVFLGFFLFKRVERARKIFCWFMLLIVLAAGVDLFYLSYLTFNPTIVIFGAFIALLFLAFFSLNSVKKIFFVQK